MQPAALSAAWLILFSLDAMAANLFGLFFLFVAALMAFQGYRGLRGGWMYAGGMRRVYRKTEPKRYLLGLCMHVVFVVFLLYIALRSLAL